MALNAELSMKIPEGSKWRHGKSAGSFMTGMEVWMRRSDRELKDMADIVAIAKAGDCVHRCVPR